MGKRRMDNEDVARYGKSVWNFFEKMQKYNAVKAKFDAIKSEFESDMDSLFHGRDNQSILVTNHNMADGEPNAIRVTRVERTSIRWDIDKLRKRIPSDVFKKVVRKEYRVVNMPHLVKYLQSCGVNPAVFKRYIAVEEIVDQDAIDKAGDMGYILPQQISGCYVVECSKPYYKVSMVGSKPKGHE